MRRRLKVIYHMIKSEGILSAVKWLLITLYRRLIPQKQVIWSVDLTKLDTAGFSLPDNIKIERFQSLDQIPADDLKTLTESNSDLMGSASSILIGERFNKGAELWLLKQNEKLAGYRWTIANNHKTPTYFPHMEADSHTIGTEIFSEFRGHALFDLFIKSTLVALKNDGFSRYHAETYLWNKRAIKAIEKAGLGKIGIATRFSIFGKDIVIWHNMSGKIEINN